ncbi:MAG: hypothetical protein U9Q20_01475 [Campylobacterota bacterium]|nr:hypothetical protein [Campylobacterota bacterium]
MKKLSKILSVTTLGLFLFTGCGYKTDTYTPSLKIKNSSFQNKVAINYGNDAVTVDMPEGVLCSLRSTVNMPNGDTIDKYIEDAFISELKLNNLYDENSKQLINIIVTDVTTSSMFGFSYWEFDATVKTQSGYGYKVSSKYEFDGHPKKDEACMHLSASFKPAVKKLLSEVVTHPSFDTLFNK